MKKIFTMPESQGTRRSGRIRNAVSTYAEEQAAEQRTTETAPLPKRKKATTKAAKPKPEQLTTDDATTKPDSMDAGDQEPPRKKSKKAKSQPDGEVAKGPATDAETPQDDEDFKPAPKKARKKRTVPIGKLDSEGVMRLDTTEQRPKGERKPARVYEIPPKSATSKGKSSVNLAAILAESFEDRWERKVSKIPRLAPGATETRLKP